MKATGFFFIQLVFMGSMVISLPGGEAAGLDGFPDIRLADIESAIIQSDYLQAKNLAEEFIRKNPPPDHLIEAQYYLGLSQLRLGQYQEANETFQKLIKLSPPRSRKDKAYLGAVDAYYLSGQYEQALQTTETALRESPRSEFLSLIYLKAARSNLRLARWRKARDYLNKITHDFPQSPESRVARQLLEEKQYFAVQVGAFLERPRAEQLIAELKAKGEYAYIIETSDQQGRTLYRVRVGQLASVNEARTLESKLSHLGYPTLIFP